MTGAAARCASRPILGMSAVLLPFTRDGAVDWPGFESLVARTVEAGLVPAVNMDTGYVQLLDADTRARVLQTAARACGAPGFVAGAFVADEPGARVRPRRVPRARWRRSVRRGGTPVIFPSHGLNALDDDEWVAAHDALGRRFDRFIGFELGPMFVPYGRIYSLAAYEGLLGVRSCIGAKHSSLSRAAEWDRLEVRDRVRPDFHVFTGNDLAIDMVCYGSDYLLGPLGVRAGGVRRARSPLGARRAIVPRAQRPAAVPRARSRSAPRCPRTATTRRCSCSSAVGSTRTPHRPARRDGPTATAPSSPTSPQRLEALL